MTRKNNLVSSSLRSFNFDEFMLGWLREMHAGPPHLLQFVSDVLSQCRRRGRQAADHVNSCCIKQVLISRAKI